jgi:hypothetical protein
MRSAERGDIGLQGTVHAMTSLSPAPRAFALAALALACLVLAGLVSQELGTDPADAASETASAPAIASTKSNPMPQPAGFALPPLGSFAEVTDRPIFAHSRRPPPPQAPQDTVKEIKTLVLEGIVLSKDERIALVTHGRPPVLARLTEGREIEGWRVVEIRADRIVIARDSIQQELKLIDKPAADKGGSRPNGPPSQVKPPKS